MTTAVNPPSTDTDDDLFQRARAGDKAAWDELFRKCYPKVIRVVRRKLDRPMRSLYDSTDFASDVMKSLAANADRLDFQSFGSLMAFLRRVAEQKVIDEYRKTHTLKRDHARERSLTPGGDGAELALASSDPTPSQFAVADEAHEQLIAGLDEQRREALRLKKDGYSVGEIAQHTGWNKRKVERFFEKLRIAFGL